MLRLYSTPGCHLCDEAKAVLANVLPSTDVDIVDILTDDHWLDTYRERIPVLSDGNNELDWPFDGPMLVSFLGKTDRQTV